MDKTNTEAHILNHELRDLSEGQLVSILYRYHIMVKWLEKSKVGFL